MGHESPACRPSAEKHSIPVAARKCTDEQTWKYRHSIASILPYRTPSPLSKHIEIVYEGWKELRESREAKDIDDGFYLPPLLDFLRGFFLSFMLLARGSKAVYMTSTASVNAHNVGLR